MYYIRHHSDNLTKHRMLDPTIAPLVSGQSRQVKANAALLVGARYSDLKATVSLRQLSPPIGALS